MLSTPPTCVCVCVCPPPTPLSDSHRINSSYPRVHYTPEIICLRERLFTFAGSLLFRSDEIFTSEDSNADVGERGAGVYADFSSIICAEKVSSSRCLVLSAYTHKKKSLNSSDCICSLNSQYIHICDLRLLSCIVLHHLGYIKQS